VSIKEGWGKRRLRVPAAKAQGGKKGTRKKPEGGKNSKRAPGTQKSRGIRKPRKER